MSEKETPQPNKSWLLSEQARRTLEVLNNPEQTARRIESNNALAQDNEDRETNYPVQSEHIEATREYSFREIDTSLIPAHTSRELTVPSRQRPYVSRTPSRLSAYSEFDLTSYESSLFDPHELRDNLEMNPSLPGTSTDNIRIEK